MGKITVETCEIEGLKVITPTVFGDSRGYFMETYNYNDFKEAGIDQIFVQDNQSSSTKNVLRGLHFQIQYPQDKLVRVINGEVFDVNTSKIYENREPRFYANIVFHGSEIFFKGDKGPVTVDHYLMDTPDKGDASQTGYNVWKWIDYDNYNYPYAGASGKDHSTNWIMIRYAEVILNEAEARVETNDIQGALKAVNEIRARVGLPAYTETNQEKLRQLIRKERRLELAFEDHRFYDVRRWRIGAQTQGKLHGLKFVSPTEFTVETVDTRSWDDRLYLHPIPYEEIIRVSAIKQNTGY